MRSQKSAGFFLLSVLLTLVLAQSTAAACEYETGDYLVKLKASAQSKSRALSQLATANVITQELVPARDLIRIKSQSLSRNNLRQRLANDIEYIEPNCRISASLVPNDIMFENLWGLQNQETGGAKATDAWQVTTGSEDVVIAVLDTAVDISHEDLAENIWENLAEIPDNGIDDDSNGVVDDYRSFNALNNSGQLGAPHQHGTHVAGIAGAKGNNGIGISGVAWNLKILPVQMLNSNGSGTVADSIVAMNYVRELKQKGINIRVINASYGRTSSCSLSEAEALEELADVGVLFVTAAGNNAKDNDLEPTAPANCSNRNVISVASIDRDGNLSNFSNYGAHSVHIAAPGEEILGLAPNNTYVYLNGTSMAAPFVTGAIGLLLSHKPLLSIEEVRLLLTLSADTSNHLPLISGGILDIGNLLAVAGVDIQSLAIDSDGDGVIDAQERIDGTDPFDRGSFVPPQRARMFGVWNGFLAPKMSVLELVNNTEKDAQVTVTLHQFDASPAVSLTVSVAARTQRDLILNDHPGFKLDAYGILETYSNPVQVRGRIAVYKVHDESYEFAYAEPLNAGHKGTNFFTFNTYQPSYNPADANSLVANWGSIANLSQQTQSFTLNFFDMLGALRKTQTLSVAARKQVDFDAGHGLFGSNQVGLVQIVPTNSDLPYLAGVLRYGLNDTLGRAEFGTSFAFPLVALAGTKRPITASIDGRAGVWLEIANTMNHSSAVSIQIYLSNGSLLQSENLTLAAFAQRHIFVSEQFEKDQTGYVVVRGIDAPIIAQTMHYHRDVWGSIEALYGIQAYEAVGGRYSGSYNLYLEMENQLQLVNTSSEHRRALVRITSLGGEVRSMPVFLNPNQAQNIEVGGLGIFSLPSPSYGFVEVVPIGTNASGIQARLLRERRVNEIEFIVPTALR